MLNGLLSKEECASCRLCCTFGSYNAEGTPTVTAEVKELIRREYLPEQKFAPKGGAFVMHMLPEPDPDLCTCPLLDKSCGCIMGDDKPFECRIWPVQVMKRGNSLVLTVSPLCPVMKQKPRELIAEKCRELAPLVFAEAAACPELVRPYTEGLEIIQEQQGRNNAETRNRRDSGATVSP